MSVGGKGHPGYLRLLKERVELHILKSGGYGTDEDPFHNFTVVARAKRQPRYVYPVDRVQEKLARVYSLIAQGREEELEQEFSDMSSLLDCATTMLREDNRGAADAVPSPGPEWSFTQER